jgi:hypothetical protein
MMAPLAVALVAAVMAAGWHRRGGGVLPLLLAVCGFLPVGLAGWLGAEMARWWLARPERVRRTLERLGIATRGRAIVVQRIAKGHMNAVLLVKLRDAGGLERRMVVKHMLRFGTLLAWCARRFSTQREYPRVLDGTTRAPHGERAGAPQATRAASAEVPGL